MILCQLKKPRLVVVAAMIGAGMMFSCAHAEVDTARPGVSAGQSQMLHSEINGLQQDANSIIRRIQANDTKSAQEDGFARDIYYDINSIIDLDDKKLAEAFSKKDYSFILSYFQARCKAEDANSATAMDDYFFNGIGIGNCHYAGVMYQYGQGVHADLSQAITYYQMAAKGGFWPSVQTLADLSLSGKGVPQDVSKGISILTQFTTNDKTPNAYVCLGAKSLGDLYRQGKYVAKSGADAEYWYWYCHTRAINDSTSPRWLTARTMTTLANMYADDDGPRPNPAKAAKIYQQLLGYKKVDPADVLNAKVHMGQLYVSGKGVPKDVAQGLPLLKSAADTGKSSDAALTLAKLYTSGDGAPADPALAAKYLQQAADGRNAEAQYMMGENALNQATPDVKEGTSWLQSSAILGYAKAQYALGELAIKSGTDADMVYAFIWFDFASQNQDDRAAKQRDEVAARLSPDQMVKAKATVVHLKEKFPTIVPAS